MRKLQLLCFLLITIAATSAHAGSRPSDRERAELGGQVRSVLTRVAIVSDGKPGLLGPGHSDTYDEQGNLQESRAYSNGVVNLRRTRSYDASGNRVERLYEIADPNGPPPPPPMAATPAASPKPDARAEDGASLVLTVPRIDGSGRVIEEVRYAAAAPAEQAIRARTTYRYDDRGRLVESERFDASGKNMSRSEYSRNAAGEVVEGRYFDAGDPEPLVENYSYEARDAKGNWTERICTTTYPGPGRKPTAVHRESRMILYLEVGKGDVAVQTKPRFLNAPRPDFPMTCAKRGVHGTVVVKGLFAADGTIPWAEVTTGQPCGLNARAIEAVYKLKFTPATNAAGRPVDCAGRRSRLTSGLESDAVACPGSRMAAGGPTPTLPFPKRHLG